MKNQNNKLVPILISLPAIGLGLAWNMNSTVVPLIVATVTKSSFLLGLLVSMASFTGLFAPYISGTLSDRVGKRKPFVLIGSLSGAIFLFLLGYSSFYFEMFIFAFLFYLSMNFYQGVYYAWVPEAVEKNAIGLATGFRTSFYFIGGIIVFASGVVLFNINPALPLIVSGIVVIVTNLITVAFVKEDSNHLVKSTVKISFDFIKNKSAMKVFMTAFFLYLSYGFIMPYWIQYYEKMNGFTSNEISTALTGMTLMGLIFSILIGKLCDRYNKQLILFISCTIWLIGFIVGAFVINLSMLWAFTLIFGLACAMFSVVFYVLIPAVAPKDRLGEYMGINNIFISLPQIIGNLIAGKLITNNAYLIFPCCIIFIIIAILICSIGKIKLNDNKI
ncbi:MFS transporter [Clostridium thermobutyricum]|uniref:MFS transporter n=1 Tax=Clostridium thermobutyricum TaxID=29372 RepID=UPI003F51C0BA